jgi:hypothetical protein
MSLSKNSKLDRRPRNRRLRVFGFDPLLSRQIETYDINEVTLELPWEKVEPGPVDEYIEVIDYDPASKMFYIPVDLNEPEILAQDGLDPLEGDPQFHQQMVYAIARTTIKHFEKALGRRALWSSRLTMSEGDDDQGINKNLGVEESKKKEIEEEFVQRLRIYPHALREANAYYSPVKKALLFGYFPASPTDPGENMPGGLVFTCLSHDIVAHETAHALLDGLHRRYIEPCNEDAWALHEAFADIVALFQHFTHENVLKNQIANTRGILERQNYLGKLAYQFGHAIGNYGALRDSLGHIDEETKEWVHNDEPDPTIIQRELEPHKRGAILVAAVFEAFLTIYKWRIKDLLRLASVGKENHEDDIHPDLVTRLSKEASKTSGHILQMCIRALDYCPPVDVNFGDYLRALITADTDIVEDDKLNYRIAVIEAFRKRGIFPFDVRNLSEESLLWRKPTFGEQKAFRAVFKDPTDLNELVPVWGKKTDGKTIYEKTKGNRAKFHEWFTAPRSRKAAKAAHIVLEKTPMQSFYSDSNGVPKLEVHSVRPLRRIGPDGNTLTDLIIEMTQRRRGYYDSETQEKADKGKLKENRPYFIFRGGCTMLIDLENAEVKYCIYKNILSENRLNRMRRYLNMAYASAVSPYIGDPRRTYYNSLTDPTRLEKADLDVEPFWLSHRSFKSLEEQE